MTLSAPPCSHAAEIVGRGPRIADDLTPRTTRIRVAETFVSRQGEGERTGNESLFIRTSGCNLRCRWCDTPYASWRPEGRWETIDTLAAISRPAAVGDVVLTGGEPLLWPAVPGLVERFQREGVHVTVETAGTIDADLRPDLLSLSPKLAASTPRGRWASAHASRRLPIEVMKRLIDRAVRTQVKFVVADGDRMDEVDSIVRRLGVAPERVRLMPEGVTVGALDAGLRRIQPLADERGYAVSDRMQIRWYGNRRGT